MPLTDLSFLPEPPSLIERERARLSVALRLVPGAIGVLYGSLCVLRQEAFVFEYLALTHLIDPGVVGFEAVLAGLRYVLFGAAAAAWLWEAPPSQPMQVVRVMGVIHGLVGGFALFVLAAILC